MEIIEQIAYNIVAIVAILSPIFIILVILVFSRKKEQDRNRLIQSLIEKGYDPQAIQSLLDKGKKAEDRNPEKHFRSGITLVAVGVGLFFTWLLADWSSMHTIGIFVAILGLGELAIAWYLRKYSK